MGKFKWSFSLIFAIFLVGILNTAAFAKDPYGLQTVQVQGTLDLLVNFTSNSAAGDTDTTKYDMHVYDPSGNEIAASPFTNLTATSGKGSKIISGLNSGDLYKIQLTYAGNAATLSTSFGVVTDSQNTALYNLNDNPGKVDKDGNGYKNANLTGYNNTRKQRSGQKVHGFYENNTNSCASCHQTHTASDDNLLFKDGSYSTCSACHDGTTGAYNSFSSITDDTPNSISGTFDVSSDAAHGSLHQADGSLQISTAPGGNNNPDKTEGSIGASTWGQDFTCTSCHAPHGSGSAEENNLNLDPLGWGGIQYVANGTKDQKNGKLFKNIHIYNKADIPESMVTSYILVKDHLANQTAVDSNFFYKRAKVPADSDVIQTYRWDGTKYIADYSLWLRDIGHKSAPFLNANTVLKNNNDTDITGNNMTVVWRDGFAFGSGIANVEKADVSIGIDVETTGDSKSLYDSKAISYIPDSGIEMTKYCAACHTDYMSYPGTNEIGVLTGYHRHPGVTDELTCVRCHFAHGTKAQIMKDKENQKATNDTLSDTNHSSALRRYIDMDSCYTSNCHNNNPGSTDGMYLDWSY